MALSREYSRHRNTQALRLHKSILIRETKGKAYAAQRNTHRFNYGKQIHVIDKGKQKLTLPHTHTRTFQI